MSIHELNAADESIGPALVSPFSVFLFSVGALVFPFQRTSEPVFGLADCSRGPSASSDALALLGPAAGRGMRPSLFVTPHTSL